MTAQEEIKRIRKELKADGFQFSESVEDGPIREGMRRPARYHVFHLMDVEYDGYRTVLLSRSY